MLYDRPYMQRDSYSGTQSVLKWLLIVNIGAYLLQLLFAYSLRTPFLEDLFALSWEQVRSFRIWTPATYSVLHDPANPFHVLFNMLVLFFVGRIVEAELGPRRLLQVYITGALVGATAFLIFSDGVLLGASAAVYAVLCLFCLRHADEEITLLLFFIIPVRMKPKWLLWILLGFDGLPFLIDLLGGPSGSISHAAHLGGLLGGWITQCRLQGRWPALFPAPRRTVSRQEPRWAKRGGSAPRPPRFTVNVDNRSDLRNEVDRILDKINESGFGALTDDEKETLNRARDLLRR